MASFQLADPQLVIELVAAEPDVASPVAVAWDADGRMYVAEMSDYPTSKTFGRIRRLEDPGDDGRYRKATVFADRVVAELAALALPQARLAFQVVPAEPGPSGADQVDLLFSAHPGSNLRSLGKTASGGELSRVRLALEVVLAAGQTGGTLVFDEVEL